MQLSGIFDVKPEEKLHREWQIDMPIEEKKWNIGLIAGPSGSGKSSLLSEIVKGELKNHSWKSECLLDDFPQKMSIKEIVNLLCAVGFSSPPDWLKSYNLLSNGEQFRVSLARTLAETNENEIAYIDEFTSVVDRNVAKVASAALAKVVRRENRKIILASCHYDVVEWLTPDWVVQPHIEQFDWSDCLQRPSIELEIQRVHNSAWKIFAPYHYLSATLNTSARCFVASWEGNIVAFSSALPYIGRAKVPGKIWREHRTVCLPDYQGVGIGTALSDTIGAVCVANGLRWTSTTSHPAMIAHRKRSPKWVQTRKAGVRSLTDSDVAKGRALKRSIDRITAGFEYVGEPFPDVEKARALWQ